VTQFKSECCWIPTIILQMRNPTDFQTHSDLNLHSSFVLESARSSFVTIRRELYKSKQIHTE